MLTDEVIPQLGRTLAAVSKNIESAAAEGRVADAKSWAEIGHLNAQSVAQVLAQTVPLVQSTQQGVTDLSQTMSLILQQQEDRLSKFVETLSNILKKIDDTNSSIVNNLK